ncbi:MAG: GHKL domain-containing protein [Lachnospiraceae bacterium]|nr:GHKL domain-containing protein [Lachnospiraceae bacterium]
MIQSLAVALMVLGFCLGYIGVIYMFCKKYLDITRTNEKIFVVSLFVGKIGFYTLCRYGFISNIIFVVWEHLFFVGLMVAVFREEIEKKLLAASMLIAATTLTENFFIACFSGLMLWFLHMVKRVPNPVLSTWQSDGIVCISWGIVILAVYWLTRCSESVFECKTKKWYMISALPLFAVTAVVDVANWGASYGILVRSGGNMGLYYDQIFSYAEFCILTVLSAFAAGFYIFGMNKIDLEQKKSDQYHLQIMAYKMLEEQYCQAERLRHDLKNHFIALAGLLEKKEWEKMGCYLKEMENSAGLGISEEMTGNRVVDVLICQKRKLAEQRNIAWECEVQIPKECGIHEFDLCVLFGNILDNAVEACERRKDCRQHPFIVIQSGMVKKCFLLEVRNSAGRIGNCSNYTKGMGEYKGRFRDKGELISHGIGLLNVKDVVRRYNGVMNIEMQEGVFVISILIPLNRAEHDIKQVI